MATRAERTALIFVTAVVVAGGVVRVARAVHRGGNPAPAAADALARQRHAVDSVARDLKSSHGEPPGRGARGGRGGRGGRAARAAAASRDSTQKRAAAPKVTTTSPPSPSSIDVDHASARELEALPRVGSALAARIVAERDANGPFGSLDSLRARVKGIGPAMVKTLEPLVVFLAR